MRVELADPQPINVLMFDKEWDPNDGGFPRVLILDGRAWQLDSSSWDPNTRRLWAFANAMDDPNAHKRFDLIIPEET